MNLGSARYGSEKGGLPYFNPLVVLFTQGSLSTGFFLLLTEKAFDFVIVAMGGTGTGQTLPVSCHLLSRLKRGG